MVTGFLQEALDLNVEKWSDVERFNSSLALLLSRRKPLIEAEGMFFASKTAWKCALLQQSLLYRVTSLACGCADAWNAKNIVCSVLAARALLETVALCEHTTEKLLGRCEARDLDAIDDLANKELFSTRNEEMASDGVGFKATNVLTFIDKLDKQIAGVRESYDFLSEWCHPNGSGHLSTYGDINRSTGSVQFSDASDRVKGIQGHVVTCFMMILFTERAMERFDKFIPAISAMDPGIGSWVTETR
jgi:hypothetical protein